MASQLKSRYTSLSHFERAQATLSDNLIGHVIPRRQPCKRQLSETEASWNSLKSEEQFTRKMFSTEGGRPSYRPTYLITPPRQSSTVSMATKTTLSEDSAGRCINRQHVQTIEEKVKLLEMKKAIRLEQCRTNQARYRNRQRILEKQLNNAVQLLREELQGLRVKRQRLHFSEKTNRSPWAIVSEVFRLLDSSFHSPWDMTSVDEMRKDSEKQQSLKALEKSFTHDVSMGSVTGMNAVLEQLRRYSLYFGEPKIQLKRVESVAPGVLTASARLSLTVTEFTLHSVFPHLGTTNSNGGGGGVDKHQTLPEKLLGQRLNCSCDMTFFIDEANGRVVRLVTNINFAESLFQLLGGADEVADVLGKALLTAECVVGNPANMYPK
ncbi:unnamed protein product [Phytophthora fragariaefolia]|uniref:Unnamed protein product n=1 Tax=Phytophthora fragariaefolia TaxID=1490495 RepID=A0A9W6XV82_9STRA|nr:unnamed protein product [Phytophthora fragariaefolia]